MDKITDDRILYALKIIKEAISNERMLTPVEIEKAKAFAAKLYISHTNREITLTNNSFQLIIDFLQNTKENDQN